MQSLEETFYLNSGTIRHCVFFFLGPQWVAVDKKVGLDRPSASLVMVDIMPPWELSRCFNVEEEALNNFSMSQDFSSTPGVYCCLRSLICVTVGNENNFAARTDWVGFRRHRKRNGNHRRQWPWRKGSIGAMWPKLPSIYLPSWVPCTFIKGCATAWCVFSARIAHSAELMMGCSPKNSIVAVGEVLITVRVEISLSPVFNCFNIVKV